ncbi:MAG: hypothetical protein GX306_10390 [Clostridiales bacterium]|jgi:competence protein ComEA|nr:hypothetical protein [Clostridiales bacterium]
MNKKLAITGITCALITIAGLCYSCSYYKDKESDVVITSFDADEKKETRSSLQPSSDTNKTLEKDIFLESGLENDQNAEYINDIGIMTSNNTTVVEAVSTVEGIYAHICGAVTNPGVYKASSGARIVDFIELAGGLSAEADGNYINQAQIVMDGQRIYIPTKDEVKDLSLQEYIQGDTKEQSNNKQEAKEASLININEATAEELMELAGIGQAKADSIIKYRNTIGKFHSKEDLMKVPGIKKGLFDQISSFITIN